MIQLNLLPSIKAEYVSAQRTKRTVIVLAAVTAIAALGIIGLLAFIAYGAQAIQLNNLSKDIEEKTKQIQGVNDLDKILTIQNQLGSLTGLHDAKPVMTRLFTYLQQTTPEPVSIDTFSVNDTDKTMMIEGKAPSIEMVNKYVDTLKFTEIVATKDSTDRPKAFSEVVLSSFSKSDAGYTYTIALKFDDALFASANPDVQLVIPAITTTRSQTQLPTAQIFAPNPTPEEE